MIRIEILPTARAGYITRACAACDSCGGNGPWVLCVGGGDEWDRSRAKGAAKGWVERIERARFTLTCPMCLRAEVARSAKGQLQLFGGAA